MQRDRILSLHPCAAVWCAGEYVELGVACADCAEIAGAFVRSATEAGLRPGMTDVSLLSLRADSAQTLSARLFEDGSVTDCTARPVVRRGQEHAGTTCETVGQFLPRTFTSEPC